MSHFCSVSGETSDTFSRGVADGETTSLLIVRDKIAFRRHQLSPQPFPRDNSSISKSVLALSTYAILS